MIRISVRARLPDGNVDTASVRLRDEHAEDARAILDRATRDLRKLRDHEKPKKNREGRACRT